MPEPLLKVESLSIEFQSGKKYQPTVSDVSFSLYRGEILALVGESGCGKSITCMSLARLLPEPPARIPEGRILLTLSDGVEVDVLKLQKKSLRKIRGGEIAYIFQEPGVSLNPVFRVGNQIAEAVELHRPDCPDPEAEAVSLLGKVGIPSPEERVKSYPHELSGGMQQRVMIAMALASRPAILVADEPTTALDVTIQAQILELIASLRRENGMSVILVTHNLGIVSQLADRVCVMYAGKIVETGPVRDVIDHPVHPYTAALLKAVPRLGEDTGTLHTIPGNVPAPEDFPAGCRFCGRCPKAAGLSEKDRELCRTKVPPVSTVGKNHTCSCFFRDEKE